MRSRLREYIYIYTLGLLRKLVSMGFKIGDQILDCSPANLPNPRKKKKRLIKEEIINILKNFLSMIPHNFGKVNQSYFVTIEEIYNFQFN